MFYLDVAYGCNGFECFLGIFTSVLDACFKCFIYLLLYVVAVASRCFKSRSGVAYEMRVGSERGPERSSRAVWRRGRCPGGVGPA